MELDINRPMVRWFFWWVRFWKSESTVNYYKKYGVGYCKFWRDCIFWAPLNILVAIGIIYALIKAIYALMHRGDGLQLLFVTGLIVFAAVCMVCLIWGMLFIVQCYQNKKDSGEVSTVTLVFGYIKAVKNKLCPIIKFKESEKS